MAQPRGDGNDNREPQTAVEASRGMKHLGNKLSLAATRPLLVMLLPVLVACQALAPALTSAIVAFGQDLLSTAAFNYRPQYAESVSELLLAMAETTTGLQFTQLPDNYYEARRQRIEAQQHQELYLQQQQQYAQPQYGQPPGYGQAAGYGDHASYDQDPYPQDPYAQGYYPQPDEHAYQSADDNHTYSDSTYSDNTSHEPGYTPIRAPFGAQQATGAESTASGQLSLDVALLAQTRTSSGGIGLTQVEDGATLYDGGTDPASGDKIKLSFRASCDCHLYVIGIDATGWVTRIYPAPDDPVLPLAAEKDYLLPAGDTWWGLDEYKGVEQIYFVLSKQRRTDLEQVLSQLPDQRPTVASGYRGIREPAVVPVRGLVQVHSPAPTTVPTSYGAQQVTPTSFVSSLDGADLVVTRWFDHR
jgi:hypothetical protein